MQNETTKETDHQEDRRMGAELKSFRRNVQQGQADQHAPCSQREQAGIARTPVPAHRHGDQAERRDKGGGQAEQQRGLEQIEHMCVNRRRCEIGRRTSASPALIKCDIVSQSGSRQKILTFLH